VVFEADNDKIELQNILMTSFQWSHHHYVTKITSQKLFQFAHLLPIKFLATPVLRLYLKSAWQAKTVTWNE